MMTTRDREPAYLGVDCGGSKSRWSWVPDAAAPAGVGAGLQPAVHGIDAAAAALAAILTTAIAAAHGRAIGAVVAALAGAGDRTVAGQVQVRAAAALSTAGFAMPVAIIGDSLAAAAGALAAGPGVLVWAGTGSFAVARAADGSLHRVGGRGYLLGDQGSGYDLVRRAAAAVVLAVDDLAPPTALADALTRAFCAPSPDRLGAVLQRLDTGAVAAQLPVVLACAAAGDAAAEMVLADGIDALAMVANAAVRQAELDWRDLPVTVGGGVLSSVVAVRDLLLQRLHSFGAGPMQVADADCGARGAALLARAWHRRESPLCDQVVHGAL